MGKSRIARPGDNVAPDATVSLTSGTANALYPVTNLVNRDPAKPFKATGTSCTIRFTWSGDRVLVGIAIINHNLGGLTLTLTNAAGLNQSVPIAANGADLLCVNAPFDFSGLAAGVRTDDIWDLAISGAATPVAIGEIQMLTALRDPRWNWGLKFEPERLIVSPGKTWGGARLKYDKRILLRKGMALVEYQSEEAMFRLLEQQAKGSYHNWLLIPDRDVNDCALVELVAFSWQPISQGQTNIPINVIEVSSGPPLFA